MPEYAEKCLRLIQSFNDPEAKHSLPTMASAWLTLAAQREKNIETTRDPAQPDVSREQRETVADPEDR